MIGVYFFMIGATIGLSLIGFAIFIEGMFL
jgi:hypothetical protein